jgi:hypothetical protein
MEGKTMKTFRHDCNNCIYLGQYKDLENPQSNEYTIYDLYACTPDGIKVKTVIARYGDDGPDYISGPIIVGSKDPRYIAYLKAKTQGLDVSLIKIMEDVY